MRPAILPSGGRSRWTAWALGFGWAAAVLVAGAGGFAGVRALRHRTATAVVSTVEAQADPDQRLLRDLPVIENKRLYDHVDNIDFLRALANPDDPELFGEDLPNL